MYISLLLTFLCAARGVLSSSFASPCKIGNRSCLDVMANTLKPIIFSGIPELGVESSDPLFMDEIKGDQSSFKYKFINSTFTGLTNCVISNLIINDDITKFQFDMKCPKISVSGKYDISGQLLSLPVEGNGDYELVTGKYFLRTEADIEKVKLSDGEIHAVVKIVKLKLVPKTAMHFDIKNLYNGQKDLSDAFHKFLHENWREVAEFLQENIWYTCFEKVFKNVNKYLQYFPLNNFIF